LGYRWSSRFLQWRRTSSEAKRSSGEHKATGTGTQGGGEPGAKKINPRAISSPGHKNMFLLPWPAMRAHPSWQRPLSGHIFFSLFFLFFLCPQRTPTQRRLLHASPYLASSRRHGSHLLDLLIIIEIHPIIISTEIPRGGAEEEVPPAGHALA